MKQHRKYAYASSSKDKRERFLFENNEADGIPAVASPEIHLLTSKVKKAKIELR